MPPIPENAQAYADMAVSAVKNIERVDLDYSPGSLKIVDGILGRFHRDRIRAEGVGATLFAFGCYVGEVFIRHLGGKWRREEETPMRGLALFIVVELSDGKICNPIGKVFKRVEHGEGEGLPYFYHVFTTT